MCHNDAKFSDRQVNRNSVDPVQNAPSGAIWSGSTLFVIPSAFLNMWQNHIVQTVGELQHFLQVPDLFDWYEVKILSVAPVAQDANF